MSKPDVRVGDTGTIFEITVTSGGSALPIGTATGLAIIFGKPDGTSVTKTATLSGDGSDGKMRYTLGSADIDVAGTWRYQARVTFGGTVWRSRLPAEFVVQDNIA